jgi:hypothetical protein
MCLYSCLSYRGCKGHVLHSIIFSCVVRLAVAYFLYYNTKGKTLGNNISLYKKCVVIFIKLLSEKIILSRIQRNITYHKCQILITLEFSWQVRKNLQLLSWNPSGGSQVVPCEQTKGRTGGQTGRKVGRQRDMWIWHSFFTVILTRLHIFSCDRETSICNDREKRLARL